MVLINRYCLLTRRFLNKSWHSTCVIQRCSSSIRSPIPPFSPSLKTNTSTQSFDAMIDSRREQARRTVLIHVDFTVPNKRQNRLICFFQLGRNNCESELYKLCSRSGAITNMTLYIANKKVHSMIFSFNLESVLFQECALIEFAKEQSVNNLLNVTSHFTNENRLPCSSRNLYFAVKSTKSKIDCLFWRIASAIRSTIEISACWS